MDATEAILNVLAGYEPEGTTGRGSRSSAVFKPNEPNGLRLRTAGSYSWAGYGDFDIRETDDPDVVLVRPKSALAVIVEKEDVDDGANNQTLYEKRVIHVYGPMGAINAMVKLAVQKVEAAHPDVLFKLRPTHSAVDDYAAKRKGEVKAAQKKAADKRQKARWEAALAKARKYAGNEHTAQAIAKQFL